MAPPFQLKSARMTNATIGEQIDNKVAELEADLSGLLGVPLDTNITAALASITAAGVITFLQSGIKFTGPAGDAAGTHRFKHFNSMAKTRRTLNQLIPDNTYTPIAFDTPVFDTDNLLANPARIVVRATGIHLAVGKVSFETYSQGWRSAAIVVNGSLSTETTQQAVLVAPTNLQVCTLVSLVATDFVELYAREDSGIPLSVLAADSHLSLHYIGE